MNIPTFKTIKQPPGSKVCVAAVAAMAVGRTLRYAENRMKPTKVEGGHYYKTSELLKFLGDHGIYAGAIWWWDEPVWADKDTVLKLELPLAGRQAIMCAPSESFKGYYHVVFWDGQHVRDPSSTVPDTTDLETYQILEIVPLTYIEE